MGNGNKDVPSYKDPVGGPRGQKGARARTIARDSKIDKNVPKPGEGHDPKYWKQVWETDPAGFKKKKWVRKASQSKTPPPSVRAKREEMATQPPPVKYASKEPKRTAKFTQPKVKPFQPRSKPKKKGGIS